MSGRPGRTGKFAGPPVVLGPSGAHVEAVDSVTETVVPLAGTGVGESVEQPVEAAPVVEVSVDSAGGQVIPAALATPADPTEINLKQVLIDIARSELSDYPGPKTNWSPSAFAKCDRAMILEHSGRKKNRTTDETALFFWIGHIIHDAVQLAVSKRLPGVIWHELAVKDDKFHVSGKIDSMRLVRMPDGTYEPFFEVYEYKGVRTRAFDFTLPQDSHVLQVAIYLTFPAACPNEVKGMLPKAGLCSICGCTGHHGSLPLPIRGRLAYIGKEDGRIETFTIKNTPELQAAVKAKLLSLQEQYEKFMKTGEMPPKLAKKQVKIKGVPQVYKRGNAKTGVKVGDPKLEDDHRTYNCDYKGQGVCCADKEEKGKTSEEATA